MDSNIQDKITTAPQKERLAGDQLREAVEFAVKKLSENVFAALKESNTPSILIYLIVKSVEPIIQAALVTRSSVKDLTKDIWPGQFTFFGRYLEDGSFIDRCVTDAVTHILKTDPFGPALFERLLVFTNAIPLLEEHLHSQEWVLRQIREELRPRQQSGKFQQLLITMPSEQLEAPTPSRGDLQISVSASKPTIVAGKEFSVFVVISNPFDVPIVLYSVETQIPIEVLDIVGRQFQKQSILADDPSFKRSYAGIRNNLLRLTWDRLRMSLAMSGLPESRIAQAVSASEKSKIEGIPKIDVSIQVERAEGNARITGAQIDRYQTVDIAIDSASPKHLDNLLWRLQAFKAGVIPIVLQPGDSVVKQFIFRTKSWLLFTPLAHTLQIQVRYAADDRDHQDTIPYQLTIQAAITATMLGAVFGGAIGAVARMLKEQTYSSAGFGTKLASLVLAVILGAILVVSFARKSGVQQIVSVEDFWGGLFLGFLTGFLGQQFALDVMLPSK
jgi:hypothetical protein